MDEKQTAEFLKGGFIDNWHGYKTRKLTAEQAADWTNYLRHFPGGYSDKLMKYVEDEMCRSQTMIVVPLRSDRSFGFCTHCKKVVDTNGRKHKSETSCPHCHYYAEIVHSWRRKGIMHKGYFEYYEKDEIDDKAFVCRGIFYRRSIDALNQKVNFEFETHTLYRFSAEGMERREAYFGYGDKALRTVKAIGSRFFKYYNIKDCSLGSDKKSLLEAIKGTPWQWCCIDKLIEMELPAVSWLRYLARYQKQPKMELIIKLGLGRVIVDPLKYVNYYCSSPSRSFCSNVICWQAKKPAKVLKMELTKQDRKFIKANESEIDESIVALMQLIKAENQKANIEAFGWSFKDIKEIAKIAYKLNKVLTYTGLSMSKIRNYIGKQLEQDDANSGKICNPYNYMKPDISWYVSDYCDYLHQVRYFNLNMTDTAVVTPYSLAKAHGNLNAQMAALEEERRRQEIQARAEKQAKELEEEKKNLEKLARFRKAFAYTSAGLFCRAAASVEELINEGTKLGHCVGTYAKRYCKGETNIVFIRKNTEPNTPYYTVEVDNNGHIIQVRGFKNCAPTDDVKQFMEEYKAYILERLSELKRVA